MSNPHDRTSHFVLIAMLLAIIIGGTALLYFTVGRAGNALRAVTAARNQAEASRLNALARQAQAEAEQGAAAEAVRESSMPPEDPAQLKASLDEAARDFDNLKTPLPPRTEAAMRSTLGSSYASINELRAAETQLARAVELFAATAPADDHDRLRAEALLRTVRGRLADNQQPATPPAAESPR
jgi:hypothetical protein